MKSNDDYSCGSRAVPQSVPVLPKDHRYITVTLYIINMFYEWKFQSISALYFWELCVLDVNTVTGLSYNTVSVR